MSRRFVLDTNTIVSVILLKQSVSRQALNHVRNIGKLLYSTQTFAEIDSVLRRSKFDRYISETDRLAFLAALVREAITECRDPKDNKFLELAVERKADSIISGDNDLLSLHPFRTIPILYSA